MDPEDKLAVGRRKGAWRRAIMAFGPGPGAKRVALILCESAWVTNDDPDGELVAERWTQKILCRLCDYSSYRGLRKQLEILAATGWIHRDVQEELTGPGVYRTYTLRFPNWLAQSIRDELEVPAPGMWNRVLSANTDGTGELQCTRSEAGESAERVNYSSGTGELQFRNRGTTVPERVNWSSPLKKGFRRSLKEGEGLPVGVAPNRRQPPFEEMTAACVSAGLTGKGSEYNDVVDVIKREFGFTPNERQLLVVQRQLSDRAGE